MRNLLFLGVVVSSVSFGVIQSVEQPSWAIATESGNLDFIYQQLQSGVDVNSTAYSNGNTALINAVESGNIDAVKLLVDAGADINAVVGTAPNAKKCALTSAFRYPEILEFLIEAGADIHIKLSQKKTPLHYAAERIDNFKALSILLKHGANPNTIDLYGKTPLHFGIYDEKIALVLLDSGADLHVVDHEGWKPFYHAYGRSSTSFLRELVYRGASLHEFTPQGQNALHAASPECLMQIRFLIEEQELNINEPSLWHDGTPGAPNFFMKVVHYQERLEDDFQILDYLIEKGADVNATVFYNYPHPSKTKVLFTVLSWATAQKVPRYVIEWLIEHGAR